jgi:hypothetical protein
MSKRAKGTPLLARPARANEARAFALATLLRKKPTSRDPPDLSLQSSTFPSRPRRKRNIVAFCGREGKETRESGTRVRRPEARRDAHALRPPPRDRGSHGELGRAQGAELRPAGQAPRRRDRRSPDGCTTASRGASPTASTARGTCSSGTAGTYETVPPGQKEAMRAKGHIAFASSARSSKASGTSSRPIGRGIARRGGEGAVAALQGQGRDSPTPRATSSRSGPSR